MTQVPKITTLTVDDREWEVSQFNNEIQAIVNSMNQVREENAAFEEEFETLMSRARFEKLKLDVLGSFLQNQLSELVRKDIATLEAESAREDVAPDGED